MPHLLTADSFGYFYTRRGLDVRTRELLSVVTLAATGASAQLPAHISGALRAGNSLLEVTAALVQALPYIGMGRKRLARGVQVKAACTELCQFLLTNCALYVSIYVKGEMR